MAQPAIDASIDAAHASVIADNAPAPFGAGRSSLGWVFLEIGVALVIAVAIVWWTLPRRTREIDDKDER